MKLIHRLSVPAHQLQQLELACNVCWTGRGGRWAGKGSGMNGSGEARWSREMNAESERADSMQI